MDAEDRKQIEKNMRNLLENQYNIKFMMQKQASVVESTVNILRTTMEDVNNNFKKIVDQMNNITAAMEETYFVYRESIRFFMVTKDLDAIIRENEGVQSSMINLLIDINHGKLNHSLITPAQLQAEMTKIGEHMPDHLKFPGKKYEQIRAVYTLLTAKAALVEDKLLVSANIPLFTQHTSQLHRIIPLPVVLHGEKFITQSAGHYLIYNFNRDAYHIMTQADLNMCQIYTEEEYVCEGNWPWIDANDNSCEVYSLKPSTSPQCNFVETKMELLWTKLHADNRWLFKVFQPTTAHVSCKGESQQIVKLPMQGIITLKPGCTLRVKGAIISTPFNLESKKIVQDKTPPDSGKSLYEVSGDRVAIENDRRITTSS
ncbi:uncharacterized protein [Musca autumnalis]|uniref:uncharacterized protein n=1 Tax=Musca autumnalis TaxID=221902 RepID=UPI003CF5EB58